MQNVDLGDRSGLIDLVYGPNKAPSSQDEHSLSQSCTASVNTLTPLTQNDKNKKKEQKPKKKVVCSMGTAVILFILAVAAVVLAAFCAYWLTKMEYEKQMKMVQFTPHHRRNLTAFANADVFYEEELPSTGPTAEELKLPDTLVPLWYNVTLKTYLPGYVDFEETKNFTTDVHLMIKMRAKENTDEIVLNSGDFVLPRDMKKIQILMEDNSNDEFVSNQNDSHTPLTNLLKLRRRRDVELDTNNNTLAHEESLPQMTEDEQDTKNDTIIEQTTQTAKLETTTQLPTMEPKYRDSGIKVKSAKYDERLQKLVISLDTPIEQNQEVILKLPLKGKMDETQNGLFRSSYKDKDGKERYSVLSNLQPTYARKLIPCFDEPEFKSPWKLSIIHPNGTIAKTNSQSLTDAEPTSDADWVMTSFAESSSRSSYLTAITVSDFIYKEAKTKSGVQVRVWTRPDVIESAEYPLGLAVKTIDALEEYFDIPLQDKKQDIFAIPDFGPEALENPGLLMFKETGFLYDSNVDNLWTKLSIAERLCKEFTHQWFGNLVSVSGWDSMWLNEAFATNMHAYILDKVLDGKIDGLTMFTAEEHKHALESDMRSSSHPLTVNGETAAEAYEILDDVTYDKGASVIHMLRNILGEENFRSAVQNYLNKHSNGNANYTDLWAAFQEKIPKDLKAWDGKAFKMSEFADKWILQMGYPVLDVYRIDGHTVEITQRRFKLDNETPEKARYRNAQFWYKWDVPVWATINGKEQPMQWLHEAIRLPINLTDQLLLNSDSKGFYRVNYDEDGWNRIIEQLEEDHTKMSASSRGRILADAFAIAAAGDLPYETLFNLTSYLTKEKDFLPMAAAVDGMKQIVEYLRESEETDKLAKKFADLLRPAFTEIDMSKANVDPQNYEKELYNSAVVDGFCSFEPESCGELIENLVETNFLSKCEKNNYSSECSTVPPLYREFAYCQMVSRGNEKEFDMVKKFAENEINQSEKLNLIRALGCSRDPASIIRLIRNGFKSKDSSIKKGDVLTSMSSMNSQPVGQRVVTEWIEENWKDIHKKLSEDEDFVAQLVKDGVDVHGERQRKQLEQFLMEKKSSARKFGAFRNKLELAKSAEHWVKTQKAEITDLLGLEKN